MKQVPQLRCRTVIYASIGTRGPLKQYLLGRQHMDPTVDVQFSENKRWFSSDFYITLKGDKSGVDRIVDTLNEWVERGSETDAE